MGNIPAGSRDPLEKLNLSLASSKVIPPDEGADHRVVLVAGCPRSGTTLMLQQLQRELGFTVVDHLVAALWRRPDIGVVLSKKLAGISGVYSSSLQSNFGATTNWQEPHEFSYFWRDALDCDPHRETEVRAASVHRVCELLSSAAAQTDKPLCLKAFPALWNGSEIISQLDSAKIIVMRRESGALRSSLEALWRTQIKADGWASLRPSGWKQALQSSVSERIDFQQKSLVGAAEELIESDSKRVLPVRLEDLVTEPQRTLADVKYWLNV